MELGLALGVDTELVLLTLSTLLLADKPAAFVPRSTGPSVAWALGGGLTDLLVYEETVRATVGLGEVPAGDAKVVSFAIRLVFGFDWIRGRGVSLKLAAK